MDQTLNPPGLRVPDILPVAGGPRGQPTVLLWRHQVMICQAPFLKALWDLEYFFLIAGYGSGKTHAGAWLILMLAIRYQGYHVEIGIGSDTQVRLRKTMLAELFRICAQHGVSYSYNSQNATLQIGTVMFLSIPLYNPANVYAYNLSAFICDELDELTQDKCLAAFRAIQERVRIPFPDGRQAFSVFLTTAQGYKGTYQVTCELEQKGIPHLLIRGRTEDNLALPRSFLRKLWSLYTENERLAFLEGFFVNLTTGRVYPDYDEAVCRVKVAPFEISPQDVVHVGQDLNAGFSRGVATVLRGNVLYVVHNWSFDDIGAAPRIMRHTFPANRILWYPDASGAEIIRGYASEIREHGIGLRIGTINPSIVDRIFFVNKLFRSKRCILFPNCNELSMALKVRQFDDRGNAEKGKGAEAPDHYCDGFEYVVWRMVYANTVFRDIIQALPKATKDQDDVGRRRVA